MQRGAMSGFVFLGVMGVGERVYTKYNLSKQFDLVVKTKEHQIEKELSSIKRQRPGSLA
jgi:hypothetical protein